MIRNIQHYLANLWDWSIFKDCFGSTRIEVTDVDGLVERNHHFLLIETKSPGAPIPKGQAILFDHIVSDNRWLVLIVWGKPGKPVRYQFWRRGDPVDVNLAGLQDLVRRWYAWADRSPMT